MHKCYTNTVITNIGQLINLNQLESNHLMNVMRYKVGEKANIMDGCGVLACCEIISYCCKKACVRIISIERIKRFKNKISVIIPILKNQNTDYIIREATAIGISEIYPVYSELCDFKIPTEKIEKKHQSWIQCCVEGCKQSGNVFMPTLHEIAKLKSVVAKLNVPSLKLFGGLSEHSDNLLNVLSENKQYDDFVVAIGPEGDFSAEEYETLRAANFVEAKFAHNVLRTETAALYALSVISNFTLMRK